MQLFGLKTDTFVKIGEERSVSRTQVLETFHCATLLAMPSLHVIAILKKQLKEARARVQRLHRAVDALERLGRHGRTRAGRISAAGRKRIADAQKARWKKFRLIKK